MTAISVVMPVFNRANLVDRAIRSILEQDFEDFELIIINDGSTDETEGKIQQFSDKRIHYQTLPINMGNAYCRNLGMKISQGEFIAVMDSDDVAHPSRLRMQLELMKKNPELTITGTFATKVMDGHMVNMNHPMADGMIKARLLALDGSCMIHPTSMIRRSFIQNHQLGYPNLTTDSDHGFWIESVTLGARFANLPQHLLEYHRHTNNLTSAANAIITMHQQKKTPLRIKILGIFFPHLSYFECNSIALAMEQDRLITEPEVHNALRAIMKAYSDKQSYWGESKPGLFEILEIFEKALVNALDNLNKIRA